MRSTQQNKTDQKLISRWILVPTTHLIQRLIGSLRKQPKETVSEWDIKTDEEWYPDTIPD